MYTCNIKQYEKYCLRLLLLKVVGCQSWEDVRTVNGIVHETFESAALARKLIGSDEHIVSCLAEAATTQMPQQLRLLFGTVLIYARPHNALSLYNRYKAELSEVMLSIFVFI